MPDQSPTPTQRLVLRKYRNRRYYDSTRSLHVTLEDIYSLVRAGNDVQVTDSQTGEDITPKVLTQVILERDPLKLGVFPVEFLHRIIRANEPLIREFVENYFTQFLQTYFESHRQFGRYLRQAMGLESPSAAGVDWMRMMMWPLGQAVSSDDGEAQRGNPVGDSAVSEVAELQKLVQQLREQVKALEGKSSDQ